MTTPSAAVPAEPYQVSEFTVIPGWFIYSQQSENPPHFSAVGPNFGLSPGKSWASLVELLSASNESNRKAESPVRYKLLFAARHGQGWHNVAEEKYSTAEWDAKWSLLTGDGEITWGPDPELTPLGEQQARDVHAAWVAQLAAAEAGMDHAPLPTRLLTSPFKRSCRTLALTYEGILLPPNEVASVPRPLIKEDFREQYGNDHEPVHRSDKSTIAKNFPDYDIEPGFTEKDERFKVSTARPMISDGFRENFRDEHTCDQRSTKREIAEYQPGWQFVAGFAEEDELFGKIHETIDQMTYRVANALREAFHLAEDDQVIHISSHSGVMESLWRVTGHVPFKPSTGAIVPMVIKWDPRAR